MSASKPLATTAQPQREPEVHCCLGCGRDTRARSQVCARCLRGPRSARALRMDPGTVTAEDDYSEESGPDSVYRESAANPEYEVET